ncbi:substrate-binding periplasmic protein [Azospirillum canadense]|uniref:substrate-binding periplasmic protein n=1 Tax=Azospirillum canadense TaxID=403962 RepID=UPI002227C3AB|nr:transporter substrate-binding domain-containing protein [Azospirillum canadense]MCW2237829.1 ABC-type amino acid transport substrate-binding protein [Azospirillum canadense]
MTALSRRQLLSFSAAALAAGAIPRRAGARPLDDVTAAGRLRVAVYRDNPPFSFHRDGKLVGVDVDLARTIAERLGVGVEYMELTAGETVADDLRNAVWKGHYLGGGVADIMMHVPYEKEFGLRNPEAVLFAPYQREHFALARNPMRMTQPMLAALPDEPVGVEIDSIPDFFLLGAFGGRLRDRVMHYMTIPLAVAALEKGEVAAVVATQSQVEAALGERVKDFPVTPVTFPGMMASSWDIGLAVKDNSRDLAYAVGDIVAAMLEDGTVAGVFGKYGVTHNTVVME